MTCAATLLNDHAVAIEVVYLYPHEDPGRLAQRAALELRR